MEKEPRPDDGEQEWGPDDDGEQEWRPDDGEQEPRPDDGKQEGVGEQEGIKTVIQGELDPDTLECPVCLVPFVGTIFQCKNGHAVCRNCCLRLGACSFCAEPIGDIRCRPLENAIASMVMPCVFARFGCARRLKFADKHDHEECCPKAPCACPVDGCAYSGTRLSDHVSLAHADAVAFRHSKKVTLNRDAPFKVLLRTAAADGQVFLILNRGGVPTGRTLSVVCLGQRPDRCRRLKYRMTAHCSGADAPLSLSAAVPFVRRWSGGNHHPSGRCLFVPDAYWNSYGNLSVRVEVWEVTLFV